MDIDASAAANSAAAVSLPTATAQTGARSGAQIFATICSACHQANAQGVPGVFPPLAHSDYFQGHPNEAARIVMGGRSGIINVNGQGFNSVMPAQELNDQEVANVLNYVSTQFNAGQPVLSAEQVHALRALGPIAP